MKVRTTTRTERPMWHMGHVGDPNYQEYYTYVQITDIDIPFLKACWWILNRKITRGQGCWVLEEDTCQS
jgi:hypothetical protein